MRCGALPRRSPPSPRQFGGEPWWSDLEKLVVILDLHRQGLSVSAIARQTGFDRKTVRRYVERGLEPPAYQPRAARANKLSPFQAYLRERVAAYPELTAGGLDSGQCRRPVAKDRAVQRACVVGALSARPLP